LLDTLASNIVFERPSEPSVTEGEEDTSAPPTEPTAPPTDSPRSEWRKLEGQPLAQLLQAKTLQTATYAITDQGKHQL